MRCSVSACIHSTRAPACYRRTACRLGSGTHCGEEGETAMIDGIDATRWRMHICGDCVCCSSSCVAWLCVRARPPPSRRGVLVVEGGASLARTRVGWRLCRQAARRWRGVGGRISVLDPASTPRQLIVDVAAEADCWPRASHPLWLRLASLLRSSGVAGCWRLLRLSFRASLK